MGDIDGKDDEGYTGTVDQVDNRFDVIWIELSRPFRDDEIKVRTQAGRNLSYVTSRAVMNRLDEVLGPHNWWDTYTHNEHSVVCGLTIRLPDGTQRTKYDAGGFAGMADPGDDDKSGYADAFKRAAVKWGVGRHLYGDGLAPFVVSGLGGSIPEAKKAVQQPRQESRGNGSASAPSRGQDGATGQQGGWKAGDLPRTGKGLWSWALDMNKKYKEEGEVRNLIDEINSWGKTNSFPGRMVDYDGDQVLSALAKLGF